MVAGVFVARWTVPVALKGTGYVLADLREKPHLIVWAVMAGMLWAVGNTLTVFAVRNVGLSIAFPLWNINSLVGLFWGWLLFSELRGSGWGRVVVGAVGHRGRSVRAGLCHRATDRTAAAGRRRARHRGRAGRRTACSAPCTSPTARRTSAG